MVIENNPGDVKSMKQAWPKIPRGGIFVCQGKRLPSLHLLSKLVTLLSVDLRFGQREARGKLERPDLLVRLWHRHCIL